MNALPCPPPDRLGAFLDGDLAPADARAVEAHAAVCPDCGREIALARRLRSELAALDAEPCPDDVFDAALARIQSLERDRAPIQARTRQRWTVGAGLALVGAVLVAIPFVTRPAEPAYSAAEVAEARREVELAFALLGEAGRETGARLRTDAFARSADAIRDGLALPH